MYNDYYLQQIDNKLATTNNNLEDVISNQETITAYLESGDKYYQELIEREELCITGIFLCAAILVSSLLFNFIVRCWK